MLADLSFVYFYSQIILNLMVKKNSPTEKGVKSILGIGMFSFVSMFALEMRGYLFFYYY